MHLSGWVCHQPSARLRLLFSSPRAATVFVSSGWHGSLSIQSSTGLKSPSIMSGHRLGLVVVISFSFSQNRSLLEVSFGV